MKRIISILFVFVMVLSLFNVSISGLVADDFVEDLELVEMFEYYYENEETFKILESALTEYNKKFGYKTEGKIRMGSGVEEFTAAEFDEEKIIIYCSFIEESPIKESTKVKYIKKIMEEVVKLCDEEALDNFVSELSDTSPYLQSIMMPILLDGHTGITPEKLFLLGLIDVLNKVLSYLSLSYLIYILIYIIYCLIKKKEIKNIRRKIILFILSGFYLSVGSLSNIISFILSFFDYIIIL